MYRHFWQQYVQEHAAHGHDTVTVNPGPLFAATLCLFVLLCWTAYQVQSRCVECRAWPVRCRCERERR